MRRGPWQADEKDPSRAVRVSYDRCGWPPGHSAVTLISVRCPEPRDSRADRDVASDAGAWHPKDLEMRTYLAAVASFLVVFAVGCSGNYSSTPVSPTPVLPM